MRGQETTMRCSTAVAMVIGSAIAFEVLACDAMSLQVSGDLATHADARRIFWQLLEQGRYGFSSVEHAAFLVRDANGAIRDVPWADAGEPNVGRWSGAFPANVIAIVHTHPNWLPVPSNIDAKTAMRTKLPVYVITRAHITKTANGSTTMVIDGDWKPGSVCSTARGSRGDLAENAARIANAARGTGGSRRWSWSGWQRRPGRTAADYDH